MRMKRGNVERVVSGETEIKKLRGMGFKEVEATKEPEGQDGDGIHLDKMKVEDLRLLAKEKGIAGAGSLKKDELLAILKDVNAGD